jgi:predicted nucleotidyltransferase
MLACHANFDFMNRAQLGGRARAQKLSANRRTTIARQAAQARWQRRQAGIMPIGEIRIMVREALIAHRGSVDGVSAFLFGSYARGEAKPDSDLDIMIVEKAPPADLFHETWSIRRLLTGQKSIDLIVLDEQTFNRRKNDNGTVQHDVAQEGVRLV